MEEGKKKVDVRRKRGEHRKKLKKSTEARDRTNGTSFFFFFLSCVGNKSNVTFFIAQNGKGHSDGITISMTIDHLVP
jgi:hypothetical protein